LWRSFQLLALSRQLRRGEAKTVARARFQNGFHRSRLAVDAFTDSRELIAES
jgi:hypothetical protein